MNLNFNKRLFYLCVKSKNEKVSNMIKNSHFLNKDHISLLILNILDNNRERRLIIKIICKQIQIERERFRKRRKDLLKKINKLSIFCHADLYFVMYQDESYYNYNSTKRQD